MESKYHPTFYKSKLNGNTKRLKFIEILLLILKIYDFSPSYRFFFIFWSFLSICTVSVLMNE